MTRSWRYVTGVKIHRHHLFGLTEMTDYRCIARVFLVTPLRFVLVRFDHGDINVQRDLSLPIEKVSKVPIESPPLLS